MARRRGYKRADPRSRQARDQGYAARSVFKLDELDRKWKLLRSGDRVLDLGAAPGSWSQYALGRIGPKGRLVAVDLQAIDTDLPGAVVLQEDCFALSPEQIADALGGSELLFDAVISDMAPNTTGVPLADHVASVELCDRALDVARRWLRPGGQFVCKLFQGEDEPALRQRVKAEFAQLKSLRPKGTRTQSVEIFLVGLGKRR